MNKRIENDNAAIKEMDRRLDIDFWAEILKGEKPPLFINTRNKTLFSETRLCLEIFSNLIRSGLHLWEHNNGTNTSLLARDLENKLIHLLPSIYEQIKLVKKQVAGYTSLRIKSWLKRDYRLRKILPIIEEGYIRERDKEGRTISIALRRAGTSHLPNLIDSTDNPQREMIEKEEDSIVDGILDQLESYGKNGHVLRKIMDMFLDGINVGKDEATTLGVKKNQVAPLAFQARQKTRNILAEEYSELEEKIDFLVNQIVKKRKQKKNMELVMFLFVTSSEKGIKNFLSLLIFNSSARKIKNLAKKEKEESNQPNNDDEAKKHGSIRNWTPESGWTTISYEESLKLKKKIHLEAEKKKKDLANTEAQIKILIPQLH